MEKATANMSSGRQGHQRASVVQRERLRHEIILAADDADDASIVKSIGNGGAERGHHHRRIDEPRLNAIATLSMLVPVKLIDERHRRHAEAVAFRFRQFPQRTIEAA